MPDKESIARTSSSSSFETTQSVAGNSALSNLRRTRSVASQLATVRPEHLDVAQPSSLPSLYIDGLRYVLEDWIHKKRRRSLSWILRYGKYVIRLSDDGTAGGRYWVCGLCDARNQVKILEAKATTSPIYHLNNDHHIYKPSTAHDNGPDSEPESSNRTSPAPSSSVSVLDLQKRAAKRRPLIVESRADIFKRLLLGWITDANIPLHGVEHKLFRQLLAFLDDEFVIEVLPTSGNTVRRWILQEFEEHTRMLKDEMNKALSKVHTSFDMWTSPNGIAILSVIAYYVDIAGTPQVRLISLEKLSGSHGGENQAILMAKVIRKYGLEKKIGFFTADNADPCDTCVRALLKMFNPRASPTGLEGLEGERRIRCVGHILNLSAKAFLEGDSSDIFDSHIAEKDQKKERELLREWRKRGPIGKLHNLVYWIRRNPQRRELFLSITSGKVDQSIMAELGVWFVDDTLKGLMVKADNDTRWNSVYLMVHRALRLRDIIDVFCKLSLLDPKEEKRVSAEDVLSCEDWVVLAEIIEILQPYLTYTKHFEGRTPRFAEVLPTMYLLKDHLSEMRQRYSSNLIPAPYRAPRITLEEPVLDCIIVAAPTDGREREQQGGLQQDTGVSTWGRYSTMESTTSGEPSSPLYQAEISVQFEDKDLDPEPFELSDDGLHFIQHSIKYAMSKLDKYRNLMERSVVYWAAMILHRGYGIGFLQLRLPNQVDSILRDFRDYFDRHYAQGNQAPVSPDSPPAFHGSKLLLRTANFPKKARKEAPDEINLYLQMWTSKTQGLTGLSKREFWVLFWGALEASFTPENIASGWRRTGLKPFDPDVVLSQVSKNTDDDSDVESGLDDSIALQEPTARELRRLVDHVVKQSSVSSDTGARKLKRTLESLQAEVELLRHENQGLRETIIREKQRRQRGKALKDYIFDRVDPNSAQVFSPQKIAQARQKKIEMEAQKEEEVLQKRTEKALWQKRVEEQKQLVLERKRQREEKKEIKRREKETKQLEREANRQLRIEMKKQNQRSIQPKHQVQQNGSDGLEEDGAFRTKLSSFFPQSPNPPYYSSHPTKH
ncbi:hypothetical protein RAB80_017816 [Fusarium oxysporum f. sp. vasinfectum]|nr:hypothetical protein RAB80_017816 [Fusarium oxysporum f. sp. vasinfectum]KAK2926543.1 hypothetical protein FoTM2_013411 [Fusarium oxysporum f. sp. vasinfectum]